MEAAYSAVRVHTCRIHASFSFAEGAGGITASSRNQGCKPEAWSIPAPSKAQEHEKRRRKEI